MNPDSIVLDSSVGAKWFLKERGSAAARSLVEAHGAREIAIVVPSLFVFEVMNVVARTFPAAETLDSWQRLVAWRVHVRELSDALMREALDVRAQLGCSLYDAFSPALANMLHAPLYSADRRAHANWPGVVLLDEGDE